MTIETLAVRASTERVRPIPVNKVSERCDA
jgi:hypothetical protein